MLCAGSPVSFLTFRREHPWHRLAVGINGAGLASGEGTEMSSKSPSAKPAEQERFYEGTGILSAVLALLAAAATVAFIYRAVPARRETTV